MAKHQHHSEETKLKMKAPHKKYLESVNHNG
jgi:hypothetical protein